MTRIIAGTFRGRRLQVPAAGAVRPTGDRVREAWMNILAPRLPAARLLDLCAGSGALGLEALSRGAAHVTFVESHPRVGEVIRGNIEALGVGQQCRIIRGDALKVLATADPEAFDLVLADPPWDGDLAAALVDQFLSRPVGNLLAVEHAAARPVGGGDTRRYGNTAITFCYPP